MDTAVENFLIARQEQWKKSRIDNSMSELEVSAKLEECKKKFALKNWLPDAIERSKKIRVTNHPSALSHPSARTNFNGFTSVVFARAEQSADGLLRTGNIATMPDAVGGAATLDVYKFLCLRLSDGATVLEHIERCSDQAKALLAEADCNFDTARASFLEVFEASEEKITSAKLKQVYFFNPKKNEYHLLSLLNNSGITFELKRRIDELHFSDEAKAARECKKSHKESHTGYKEIQNLTIIKYGGSSPQNISALNNQFAGQAYLLSSLPPKLSQKNVKIPTSNFFNETLPAKQMDSHFNAFHQFLLSNEWTMQARNRRDDLVRNFMDFLIEKMWSVRATLSAKKNYDLTGLSACQRVLLCPAFSEKRKNDEDWLESLTDEIADEFMKRYRKTLGVSAIHLGPSERLAVKEVVASYKEFLR